MVMMEYVNGRTLAAARGKMKAETEQRVHKDFRSALDLLHDHGLVFGDLRPPNVMIADEDEILTICCSFGSIFM
jgi:tRNA A-37 threonylcarbamoyl transferase component Bud32